MQNEIQKLTDTLDLMRDEFRRIKACPADKWAKPEIDQLCDRAIQQIEQNVPVIVQLDRAHADIVKLRTTLNQIAHPATYGTVDMDPRDIARRALILGMTVAPLPSPNDRNEPRHE